MVPGEFVEQTICFKNIGTIAAGRVWYDCANLPSNASGKELAKKLMIVDVQDNADGGVNVKLEGFNSYGNLIHYMIWQMQVVLTGWMPILVAIYPFLPANGTVAVNEIPIRSECRK